MAELRRGQLSDYDMLMEQVVASFRERNPSHGRFEDLYPDSISRTPECMAQWLLVIEDGVIAAGLQMVPRPTHAGGCRIPMAGIGNVFCYPAYRRRGFMSQLLAEAIRAMTEEGFALAILGGDRTRYGHFGWEHAGTSRRLSLSRHVSRHGDSAPGTGIGLREWQGNPDDTKKMFAAYCRHSYRLETEIGAFSLALSRPGQVVWLCDTEAEGFGYMSVRGKGIAEYAGSVTAVGRILEFLLESGEHSVVLPPSTEDTDLEQLFLENASSYTVVPTGMINVLSVNAVLQAYRTVLERRLCGWNGKLTIADVDKGIGCTIECGGSGLSLAGTTELDLSDGSTLALPTRQLAPLCFGPFPVGIGKWGEHPVIRRMFPLPIHWHALAHV